ncbi:alpha/beta fold hydrolase [Lentisalinibacter salinarum]|uniref:alpha/beta fold hydrolase n=1 Tax=Lentisalinibacter salinarum TaxID=2992239 RepID=UPI00386E7F0A
MRLHEVPGRRKRQLRRSLDGPAIEWWKTEAGTIRVLHRKSATGPRLLFAADGPNVLEHYDDLLAALQGRADVVVYEPPGTGGSMPEPGFGYRLTDFADNAAEILKRTGPRVLVFPCYMSLVAGALARTGNTETQGVVLPQGTSWAQMHRWIERVDPLRVLRTPLLGQLMLRVMPRRVSAGWYAGSSGPAARQRLQSIADDVLKRGGCFCLASLMQNFERGADHGDTFDSVPSVVVWGDLDRSHGPPGSVSFPAADVIEHFPETGHSPELEAPGEFAEWLLRWCHEQSPFSPPPAAAPE